MGTDGTRGTKYFTLTNQSVRRSVHWLYSIHPTLINNLVGAFNRTNANSVPGLRTKGGKPVCGNGHNLGTNNVALVRPYMAERRHRREPSCNDPRRGRFVMGMRSVLYPGLEISSAWRSSCTRA